MFISPFYWRPHNWSLHYYFSPLSLNATLGLSFLSPTPFLETVSLFLMGYLSLLPPLSFFSVFEFYQEFMLTDLAPPLFDFLHVRIDNFVNRLPLNWLFWTLSFCRAVSHRIFWSKSLNRPNYIFLKLKVLILLLCCCSFPSGSWTGSSYSHCRQEYSSCDLPGMFFLGFRAEVQQSASPD